MPELEPTLALELVPDLVSPSATQSATLWETLLVREFHRAASGWEIALVVKLLEPTSATQSLVLESVILWELS